MTPKLFTPAVIGMLLKDLDDELALTKEQRRRLKSRTRGEPRVLRLRYMRRDQEDDDGNDDATA